MPYSQCKRAYLAILISPRQWRGRVLYALTKELSTAFLMIFLFFVKIFIYGCFLLASREIKMPHLFNLAEDYHPGL